MEQLKNMHDRGWNQKRGNNQMKEEKGIALV